MKNFFRLALAASIACVLFAGPLAAQDVDWDYVKSNWDSFTEEEQAVYIELKVTMGKPQQPSGATGRTVTALGQELQPVNRIPDAAADQCGMSPEVSVLPFSDSDDTTGAVDDYDIDTVVGACNTGFESDGPDQTYLLRVDVDCDLTVTESAAAGGFDVVLWAVTDCADTDNTCIGSADGGNPESFTFSATAGTDYWLIMDGFSTAGADLGPYTIDITEATANGCQLVPVELQTFSID